MKEAVIDFIMPRRAALNTWRPDWLAGPVVLSGLHETDRSPFEHLAPDGFAQDLRQQLLGLGHRR